MTMFIELLLSYFEIIIFFSIIFILMGIISLFLLHKKEVTDNKNIILHYVNIINNSSKETKEYLIGIGNILEEQKNEVAGAGQGGSI